jgi:membrane protein implicated in regulation of membrane protease activity
MAMNIVYIATACVGFILLIAGLVLDDVFDGLDLGPDWISVPVLGAALGAFGIGGWVTGSAGGAALFAVLVACIAAVLFAVATVWFVAKVRDGHTDGTPKGSDLVGLTGKVVTPLAGGRGEVLVRLGGQPRKLAAYSDDDVAYGEQVVVVERVSESAVRVMAQAAFWSGGPADADPLPDPALPESPLPDPALPESARPESPQPTTDP